MNIKYIIVPTQYFDPEIFQVNHLVALLLKRGWNVTVIAPIPSYPSKDCLTDQYNTVSGEKLKICRFPTLRRNGSMLSAAINSGVYVVFATILTFYYATKQPSARIFAVQYSPFTCILPAWIACYALQRTSYLWVFDLWPQSLRLISKPGVFSSALGVFGESIIKRLYASFSTLFVSSPAFLDEKLIKNHPKINLLASWEPPALEPCLNRAMLSFDSIRICSIGNIGKAHDIELLQLLLRASNNWRVKWVFIGGGSEMQNLQKFCHQEGLLNASFLGFLSKQECLSECANSDLSIIPFQHSSIADTICYRFVSSLSVGTPVISFADNAISRLSVESGCGITLLRDQNSGSGGFYSNFDSLLTNYSAESLLESIMILLLKIRVDFRLSAFSLFETCFSESSAVRSLASAIADF